MMKYKLNLRKTIKRYIKVTPDIVSNLLFIIGAFIVSGGVAWVYAPAGVILFGLFLLFISYAYGKGSSK